MNDTAWRGWRRLRAGLLMLTAGLGLVQAAQAQFATGGSGAHRGRIFWVSFGTAGENVYAGRSITRSFHAGSPATAANEVAITCTLGNASTTRGTPGLSVYTPGNWQGDGLDDLYHIGGAQTGSTTPGPNPNTLAIGLSTNGSSTVEFDFSCSATLGGSPFALNGLVFADAEASGGIEYVAARLTSGGTLRVIDSISRCGNAATVQVIAGSPQEVRLVPGASGSCQGNATASLRAGPALVGFIDGATSARVIAQGSGVSAVAVGAVLDLEYSEAVPPTYGVATHVLNATWSGGLAVDGVDYTQPANLATITTGVPRLGSLNLPDVDANGAVGGADVDALPKTTGPLGSGYADIAPPTARGAAYTVAGIACQGPGAVAGWIDFDGSGSFDAGERSGVANCSGSNVSLTWTVPSGYVAQATSHLRLRTAPLAAGVAAPTGLVSNGEAEDYRLVLPALGADLRALTTVPAAVVPGQPVTVTGTCTNHGPDAATSPSCALTGLPPGATQTCTPAPAPNPLPVGDTITCTSTFPMPAGGPLTVTTTADATTPDPDGGNDSSSATTGPILAVDDAAPAPVNGPAGGTAIADLLANDSRAGSTATLSTVTLRQVSSTQAGVTLDLARGALVVAPGTPLGPHHVDYEICAIGAPTVCDTARATVVVDEAPIDAVDDATLTVGPAGGSSPLLANDVLDGRPATPATVTLALTNAGGLGGLSIDAAGRLQVPANAAPGLYTVSYRICDRAQPGVCDTATVPVIVQGAIAGSVWLDRSAETGRSSNRQRDPDESGVAGWTVEAVHPPGHPRAGELASTVDGAPAVATTDARGDYRLSGLPPGDYRLRFRAPTGSGQAGPVYGTPVNGERGTPQAGSRENASARLLEITVPAGGGLSQQSLPVDPSGVVYDAITRQPVTTATVTLLAPDGQPLSAALLLPGQQDQAVVPDGAAAGSYRFDLLPGAPAGVYTLRVNAPAGYVSPSRLLPPAAPLAFQAGPGDYRVVPSATAPQVGEPTTYHLQVTLNPPAGGADVLHNHIPLDAADPPQLAIDKRASVSTAEIGDLVRYTIRVRNLSPTSAVPAVSVIDRLPAGFRYVPGTTRLAGTPVTVMPNPAGAPGPQLSFALGTLAASQTIEFSYHLKLGVAAADGDGINRAQAQSGVLRSLTAQAAVKVGGGVFRAEACMAGKIFSDCGNSVGRGTGNGVQDPGEPGIPGVRLYLEDGTWLISDSEGKYSHCGLSPRTHVLKVDPTTLPRGARLGSTSNRNAGDPGSLFLDLKQGELGQADFRDMSCSAGVLDEIERRRSRLRQRTPDDDVNAPVVTGEGRNGPGLGLDAAPARTQGGAR